MKKHKKNVPLGGKQLNDTVFALLDSFPEPVFLIDPAGKILDANTAFTSIISPHYPKFLGANVYSIHAEGESFPEIASGLKEKAEEVLRTGKRLAFEETQDGKTCRHTITPSSSPDGRISHLFIIVQEIVSHDFSSPKRIAGEDQQELAIYKTILDSIPCSVAIMDGTGRVKWWNQYTRDVIVVKPEDEMTGFDAFETIHPDDQALARKQFLKILDSDNEETVEVRRPLRIGADYVWRMVHGRRIILDGQPCVLAIGMDITDRKRSEYELIESQKRFRQALEAAHAGVWEWDLKTNKDIWSEEIWRLNGLERGDVQPSFHLWTNAIHPDDRNMVIESVKDASRKKIEINIEYRVFHPDGSLHWLMGRAMPLCDDNGSLIRYIGTTIDITDRKQIEERLIESKKRFDFALYASRAGIWEWDMVTNENIWSDEIWNLFGLEPGKVQPTQDLWLSTVHPDDRNMVIQAVADAAEKEMEMAIEYRTCHSDAPQRWFMSRGLPLKDDRGRVNRYIGTVIDITERRELLESLKRSEAAYHSLFDNMLHGFAHCKMLYDGETPKDFIYLEVNKTFETLTGLNDVVGRWVSEVIPGIRNTSDELFTIYGRVARTGIPEQLEYFVERLNDWYSVSVYSQQRDHFSVLFDVITKRKNSEQEILAAKAKLEATLDSMSDAVFVTDAEANLEDCNEAFATFHRFRNKVECIRSIDKYLDIVDYFLPDGEPASFEQRPVSMALRGETGTNAEYILRRRDTGETWVGSYGFAPIRNPDGEIFGSVVSARDITKQKQIEIELNESKTRFNLALEAARAGVWEWDMKTGSTVWSDETWALCGLEKRDDPSSMRLWASTIHPHDREAVLQKIYNATRKENEFTIEYRVVFPDGSINWQLSRGNPLRDTHGKVTRYIGTVIDITGLKQLEDDRDKLRENKAGVNVALEICRIGWWEMDFLDYSVKRSLEHERVFGYDSLQPEWNYEKFLDHIIPEDREEVDRKYREAIAQMSEWNVECRIRRTDGELRWIWAVGGYQLDKSGTPSRMYGLLQDITMRKLEEEEKANLQEQLLQAQKMELIGQLAGGIAHDFNNVLTVILGNTELLLEKIEGDHPFSENLENIRKSVTRTAELIYQLLAFARKQTVKPKIFELDEALFNLRPMLRRLIRENIQFDWRLESDHTRIRIDPSQIDQIITNLFVNARDAITGSGLITIETAPGKDGPADCTYGDSSWNPGDYVRLSVTDTGSGIGINELPHIFEPYFTTKETGKGTGLGLSTVYGIVKQNDGYIDCRSKPGKGTTFNIYLPTYTEADDEDETTEPELKIEPVSETVLLVEDEPHILTFLKNLLEVNGYSVLLAPDADKALTIGEAHRYRFTVLVTDIMLPTMNGIDLYEKLREVNPDLKVLFMSGYAPETIGNYELLETGKNFIQKPFSIKDFTMAINRVMTSSSSQ